MVAPKHPHAWIDVDNVQHPAVIIEWVRIESAGMYGMPVWMARCLYWDGEKAVVALVPEMRVKKVG